MRVFKNKWFHGWAAREGLGDQTLLAAQLLGYTNPALVKAIKAGELIEVKEDG